LWCRIRPALAKPRGKASAEIISRSQLCRIRHWQSPLGTTETSLEPCCTIGNTDKSSVSWRREAESQHSQACLSPTHATRRRQLSIRIGCVPKEAPVGQQLYPYRLSCSASGESSHPPIACFMAVTFSCTVASSSCSCHQSTTAQSVPCSSRGVRSSKAAPVVRHAPTSEYRCRLPSSYWSARSWSTGTQPEQRYGLWARHSWRRDNGSAPARFLLRAADIQAGTLRRLRAAPAAPAPHPHPAVTPGNAKEACCHTITSSVDEFCNLLHDPASIWSEYRRCGHASSPGTNPRRIRPHGQGSEWE
jgi:hypothetical protein